MTELQRISAELAGMAKRTDRHCETLEEFCSALHDCMRCGQATTSLWYCADCERNTAPDRVVVKVPACGTCGDSGRVPNEGPLRWSDPRYDEDDSLVCPDCPTCRECGVELREHGEHQDCP